MTYVRKLIAGVALALLVALVLPAVAGAQGQTVYAWGRTAGSDLPSPTAVNGVPGTVAQLVTIDGTVYALNTAGRVWAWGNGENGQLGNGATSDSSVPVQVEFPAGVTIASLALVGPNGTELAIDTDGNLWGWGYNSDGQLCSGNRSVHNLPIEMPFMDVKLAIGAGDHSLVYAGGVLYACGGNGSGDLADGTMQASDTPQAVIGLPAGTITALSASWEDSGAVIGGQFFDWGFNPHGELGNSTTRTSSDVPRPVNLPAPVAQVSEGGDDSGNGQTLAVLSTGAVYGWGDDRYGQLCDGAREDAVNSPVRVTPPSGVTWRYVYSGGATSYIIDSTGKLWACGENRYGEVGNGTKTETQTEQLLPEAVLSGVEQVSATAGTVAALTGRGHRVP